MLEEEISKKRKELNESIEKNRNYDITYKLSIELDDLIAEFYRKTQNEKKRKTKNIIYGVGGENAFFFITKKLQILQKYYFFVFLLKKCQNVVK